MFAGGELGGYAICEGTEQEITLENWKYLPYIKVKTYPILSVNQVAEMIPHVLAGRDMGYERKNE
jgi:1,4-dihydroxy-2-naphthoyl-CoA synthase